MSAVSPTVFAAFAAGALSFVSPCVLPLVPGYLSVLTGGESTRPKAEQRTGQILGPGLLAVAVVASGLLVSGSGSSPAPPASGGTLQQQTGAQSPHTLAVNQNIPCLEPERQG
ncbi:MAG: cytochrome c biogenesis CcdA family protein [Solirubrobacteraceae bacterium]